jgi:hypothetical protein
MAPASALVVKHALRLQRSCGRGRCRARSAVLYCPLKRAVLHELAGARRRHRADVELLREGLHGPGGGRAVGSVAAQFLPVLRGEVRAAPRAVRGVGALDCRAPPRRHRRRGRPLAKLRTFTVECSRVCQPARKSKRPKRPPTPILGEFAQQLLTEHPNEAARAFVPLVTLFEEVLTDAASRSTTWGSTTR